jgi:hypothetical protein
MLERVPFTLHLARETRGAEAIARELTYLLSNVKLEYRVATETGIGDWSTVRLGDHLDSASIAAQVSTIAV